MYSIGEVEKITGIKSHILRYWEEVIPAFKPKKDQGGRRDYSQSDLEIIFRLKYLIYTKKLTIEGARRHILQDTAAVNEKAEAVARIKEMRAELSRAFMDLHTLRKKNT